MKLAIGTGSAGGADSDSGERCSSCGGVLRTGATRSARGATGAAFMGALGNFVDGDIIGITGLDMTGLGITGLGVIGLGVIGLGVIGLIKAVTAFDAAFSVGLVVGFVVGFLGGFAAGFAAFFFATGFDASFLTGFLAFIFVGFRAASRRLAPPLARPFDDAWAGLRDFVALAMGVHANVCEASLSNGTDA